MTREEAIKVLNMVEAHGLADEAKRMAIEALSADAVDVNDVTIHYKPYPSADAEWIPCSERLPEDSGDYLVCPSDGVIEDYSDCSDVMIMPYDADCEAFGWWTERYDPISLGFVDSDFNEFEVVAWMPLPTPYKGGDTE